MFGHDPPLAFAIIAIASRLEDPGRANRGNRPLQILCGIDRCKGCGLPAEVGHEALLVEPVLRHFKRAGIGQQGHIAQRGQRANGDILKLIGHHRAVGGEGGHGRRIAPIGTGELGGDVGGDGIAFRREDMHPVAQPRGGHGQHPAQLAAPENADGFTRGDHHCLSSAARQRWRFAQRETP